MSNHVARAAVVVDDVGKDVVEIGKIGRRRAEQAARRLGVAHDRRQRLVQLMRQRDGQDAHGRNPGDMRKLLAGALHFLFSAPVLGDLAVGDNRAGVRSLQTDSLHDPPAGDLRRSG